jgi:hypothetical protein
MTRTESNASAVMDIPHLDPSIMAGSRMVMGAVVIPRLSDKTMKIADDSRVKPGDGTRAHGRLTWAGRSPLFRRHPGVQDSSFTVNRLAAPNHIRTRLKDLIESFME